MMKSRSHGSSKDVCKFLHSITDSQDWNATFLSQGPHIWGYMGRIFFIDRTGSTTENNGVNLVFFQLGASHQTRVELAIDVKFTDSTSNQMRILRTKVQNGDLRTTKRENQ